jgi:hypothetical protein
MNLLAVSLRISRVNGSAQGTGLGKGNVNATPNEPINGMELQPNETASQFVMVQLVRFRRHVSGSGNKVVEN